MTKLKNPFDRTDNYSPAELMVGTGLTTPIYSQWKQRGIFDATVKAEGSGTRSLYTFGDIAVVALIVELKDYGIRLQKAKQIAVELIDYVADWQESTAGNSNWPLVYVVCKGKEVKVFMEDNQNISTGIWLNLDVILSNVCGRIEEMQPE